MMTTSTSNNDDQVLLAAALSAILGKEILTESNIPQESQQALSKVSLFDQHLTSFVYGKVGTDDSTGSELLMTLHINILATKNTHPCVIERNASVDKLKQIIYEKEGILCNKQNLIFCGQEIDEGHLLNEYGITDSSVICVVRLRAVNADDLLIFDKDSWNQRYDYDFTNINDNGKRFSRGNIEYRRPCGWKRYAIKIDGKYENNDWLSSNNGPNEWPVSYHGTGRDAAKLIAETGFDLTKHKRHVHGRGIYSTPDINVAIRYAKSFIIKGETYLVLLQNRVNPKSVAKLSRDETGVGEYWISPTNQDIRPYGICIKKK